MGNFKDAQSATATAMSSQNSAAKENSKYMDSLSARINLLKAAWQSLTTNVLKSDFLKGAVSALTRLVQAVNTTAGAIGTAAGIIGLAFVGLRSKMVKSIAGWNEMLSSLTVGSKAFNVATANVRLLSGALTALPWTAVGLAATAATIAIVEGIKKAIAAHNQYSKEEAQVEANSKANLKDAVATSTTKTAMAQRELKHLQSLMSVKKKDAATNAEIQATVNDLNGSVSGLGLTYDSTTGKLNKSISAIKESISAMKQQAVASALAENYKNSVSEYLKLRAKQTTNTQKLQKAEQNLSDLQSKYGTNIGDLPKEIQQKFLAANSAIKSLKDKQKDLDKSIKDGSKAIKQSDKEYKKYLKNPSKYIKELTGTAKKTASAYNTFAKEAKKAGVKIPKELASGMLSGKTPIPKSVKTLSKYLSLEKEAKKQGAKIPKSLSDGILSGKTSFPKSIKTLSNYIKFDKQVKKAGKSIPKDLANSILQDKISIPKSVKTLSSYIKFDKDMKDKGIKVPKAIADGILTGKKSVTEATKQLTQMKADTKSASSAGKTMGTAFTSGMKSTASKDAATKVVTQTQQALSQGSSQATTAGKAVGTAFTTGVSSASSKATSTGKTLATNAKSGMSSVDTTSAGTNAAQGFVNGASSSGSAAYSAGQALASQYKKGIEKSLDEHSPSKETHKMGAFGTQGFVEGANSGVKNAKKSGEKVGSAFMSGISKKTKSKKSTKTSFPVKVPTKGKYKKRLSQYQSALNSATEKGKITYTSYYKHLEKLAKKYYKSKHIKLKQYKAAVKKAAKNILDEIEERHSLGMISDASYAKSVTKWATKLYKSHKISYKDYRQYIHDAHEAQISELDTLYEQGRISGAKYYAEITSLANKWYKQGKISYDQYISYIQQGMENVLSDLSDSLDRGELDATQYYKKAKAVIDKLLKQGKITKSEWKKLFNEIKESAISAAEDAADAVQEKISTTLDAFDIYASEQEKIYSDANDALQEQIDTLQEQEDALDEENDTLSTQNELLEKQQALEDAKKERIRIYSAAEGWHWEQNTNAIKEAQDALDEYTKEQASTKAKSAIEAQIKLLEEQIKANEKLSDQWSTAVEDYQTMMEKEEWEAKNGMSIEEAVFEGREANLENFKINYRKQIDAMCASIRELIALEAQLNSTEAASAKIGGSKKPGGKKSGGSKKPGGKKSGGSKKSGGKTSGGKKKANGANSLSSNGLYNVDERGDELIIPPASGRVSYFEKGTGIIPANMTANLMEIGKYNLQGLRQAISQSSGGSTDNSTNISISNLTVKSDNAQSFVKQLKNLAIVS